MTQMQLPRALQAIFKAHDNCFSRLQLCSMPTAAPLHARSVPGLASCYAGRPTVADSCGELHLPQQRVPFSEQLAVRRRCCPAVHAASASWRPAAVQTPAPVVHPMNVSMTARWRW